MKFEIDFEPVGRRINNDSGSTLLDAAQRAGIMLNATCGGEGYCGQCVVRVMEGAVSPPNLTEEEELGDRVDKGWRLACQTVIEGDVKVHVPPDSLATQQRTQTEGRSLPVELDPAVQAVELNLPLPSLEDLRSDATRMRDSLKLPDLDFPYPVLRTLSVDLREYDFNPVVFLCGSSVVGVRPQGSSALGLAVDLGTTKLAGYLLDLATGETLATAGAMNPQIAFGEDLMARIGHVINAGRAASKRPDVAAPARESQAPRDGRPSGGEQLQSVIVEALNGLAAELCAQADRSPLDIADAVIVGNTAMHHIFLNLPVKQLGLAPYVAAETNALDIPADYLGLNFAPGANVHLLPNIAGFIGADHVAMLLGSGMVDTDGVILGLDIGTNTEISLIANGRHYSCSAASGPAFEGAHILHGMRAGPGAIEKVLIHDGKVMLQTIDDQPAVGLCGSGILDVVAQLFKHGIINNRGGFENVDNDHRVQVGGHGKEFVLVRESGNHHREITFTRSDVNEVQLAKGAIRTGINVLMHKAGVSSEDIDQVIIAGAFGTYLDVDSCIEIGMFPPLERERFTQVGNAAGAGARMALLSKEKREQAKRVAHKVSYVELTIEPIFSKTFARSLLLG